MLWVEGPSDVIYWRFWLANTSKARRIHLVEGFDYSFMFSAGALLANETIADNTTQLAPGAINLLRLVGASRVIVDTDFNPDEARARIPRNTLEGILSTDIWHEHGFVDRGCRQYLMPRVREMADAIDELGKRESLSSITSTWGREAENGLSNDAFRRTLKHIYNTTDATAVTSFLEALVVDDWHSYEQAIENHLMLALGRSELADLQVDLKDGPGIARMSLITTKRVGNSSAVRKVPKPGRVEPAGPTVALTVGARGRR